MLSVYNFSMRCYVLLLNIAAFFVPKARLWVAGRKNIFEKIKSQIAPSQDIIWIHVASLGEFEQGRPLLEKLKKEKPNYKICLTFFSPSGYEIRKNYPLADYIFYLPSDSAANAQQFLDLVQPKIIIFVKYEFWYHYLNEATSRRIPTYYIAAIFSEKSSYFRWYFKFYKPILKKITHYFVQNEASYQALQQHIFPLYPIPPISVVGDPRIDRVIAIANEARTFPLIEAFAKNQPVLIAGSTWPPDEALLLRLAAKNSDWKIIVAPHNTDKNNVQRIENQWNKQYNIAKYSQLNSENVNNVQVILIDNIGMLSALYRYGRVAYIGGGFGVGIHNTLEPMAWNIPVIFGPKYHKFEEANVTVTQGANFAIQDEKTLIEVFEKLKNKTQYDFCISKIHQYMTEQQGATQLIFDALWKTQNY